MRVWLFVVLLGVVLVTSCASWGEGEDSGISVEVRGFSELPVSFDADGKPQYDNDGDGEVDAEVVDYEAKYLEIIANLSKAQGDYQEVVNENIGLKAQIGDKTAEITRLRSRLSRVESERDDFKQKYEEVRDRLKSMFEGLNIDDSDTADSS